MRIQALAKEMGYQPHPDLARLMVMLRNDRDLKDRPVLALITDYETPLATRNPESETWHHFAARATQLGYLPQEFHQAPGASPARLTQILHARGIRGLVFAGLVNPSLAAGMDLSTFACSQIGNTIRTPLLPRCSSDKYSNTLLACEKLWAAGCRRIGLIVPFQQEERVEHTFLSGYLVFHHLHRHKHWSAPLVDEDPWSIDRIRKWIAKHRPDGLLAAYDSINEALNGKGLDSERRPRTAVVNVDDGKGPGIDQRHGLIAEGAVDLVDAQLKRNESGVPKFPKFFLVRGHWVD